MRRPCIEGLTAVIDYTAGARAPDTALSVPRTGVVACRRVIGREYTHRTCAALGGRPRDIDPGSRESGNQPVATGIRVRTSADDIVPKTYRDFLCPEGVARPDEPLPICRPGEPRCR